MLLTGGWPLLFFVSSVTDSKNPHKLEIIVWNTEDTQFCKGKKKRLSNPFGQAIHDSMWAGGKKH